MFESKKKTQDVTLKTIEKDTRRKFENELNKLTALGWEPIWESYRVTTPLGGLIGKSIYTIILKRERKK